MQNTPSSQSITLYQYWRSSCSWRVRWALAHKGVAFNDIPVNLLANEQNTPEYLRKNPGGFVPALEINGDIFGESLAMLEWIEETYRQKPLLPQNSLDRMRVRQMCQMIASGIQPIQNLSVMRMYSSDANEQAKWARHWIAKGLDKLEQLTALHAGSFCFGGTLTFADLCLVPQMYNANRFNVDIKSYPTLNRINQHCLTLADCIASAPQNQKGATA